MVYQLTDTKENSRSFIFMDKKIELKREDPYGFWVFKWESGNPPEVLSGNFTTVSAALENLENYYVQNTQKRKTVSTKE